MAYIGQPPFQEFTNPPTKDTFTGDGSTVAFDLDKEVPSAAQFALEVYVNNVRQEPGTGKAFTLGVDGSGDHKRITFTAAPANGAAIYVINDKTNTTTTAPIANDLNGTEIILDVDGDTSITADTDDRIDFKIANVEHFSFSNSSGDTVVKPMVDAKDIIFQQYDGNKVFEINDGNFVGVGGNATAPGEIRIFEDTDLGSHYTGFKAGNNTESVAYVLPTADGSAGFQLTTDGSGTLSWSATGNVPSSANGQALGSASLEWSDLFLADGGVIYFGDDQDVTLTHVADTGLLLNGTSQLQFNDASQNINAPSATVLDINATDEIELNATLVDVNANLDVSGTITSGGVITGTAFTAGSAVLAEAELELLDGLTAGTAIASKVVTTDASIDTSGQRNLTISGELDAATGDFSGVVDIAGATTTAAITASGIIKTDDTTAATSTTDGSLQTDGGLSVAGDAIIGDDVTLISDAAVLSFGANAEVSLTHVHDTGILLNSTNVIQFNDASQNIGAPSNAILDINATDEIELNATLVDVNANLDVSGTITSGGVITGTAFTAGSAVLAEAELEKLDGITNGAGAANKALVLDGSADVASGLRNLTASGTLQGTTITATTAFVPDASDGAALGTTALEFSDLFLADGAVIGLGDDQEVTLTHVADTGLTLNSTNKLMFNDASQFIQGASATVLDIAATDEIELTATLIEVVGNATVSGTLGVTGVTTSNAGVVVDNITIDGTEIDLSSGNLTIDVAGSIVLDADGGDIAFKDAGTSIGGFLNTSSNFVIQSEVSDKDIIFKGNDGGSSVTALTLDMSGAGAAVFNNDVTAFSDKRLKKDIKNIENALSKVMQMQGVYYKRNDVENPKEQVGVLAQDMEEILPQVVLTSDDEMKTKSVDYGKLCAVLIESIKELKVEIDELKGK